ncbi:MAG: methyltransferase domain-containing protein [Victivallaceae bacterium]|nr:methyltransferase domain-containing protein [Victivallaceae bacterium]
MRTEKIHIRDFAFGGEAVGELADGRVCFVRGAAPGETVEAEIISERRRFCRAVLVRVLESVPERTAVDCPFFARCPGCSYRHVSYETELAAKTRQFDAMLNRNRAEIIPVSGVFGAPSRNFWRNRLRLHSDGNGRFGYRAADNRTLVPIDRCLLATEKINAKLSALRIDRAFRGTFALDECAEAGAVCDLDADAPGTLTGSLGELGNFSYRRGGFFQTNEAVATELVRRVVAEIAGNGTEFLLELFCGVGVFSISAARVMPTLHGVGIEIDRGAVREARRNAGRFGVGDRCRFFAGDAAKAPLRYASFMRRFKTLALVDPPRTGLDAGGIAALTEAAPETILYVSCGADTLRRDLDRLAPHYRATQSALLDMFPGTAHFESLTRLERREKR